MKKIRIVLGLLFAVGSAMASYGLKYYSFQIIDQNGDEIKSGLKYTVETTNAGTAATIYNKRDYISSTTAAADTISNSATRLSTSTPYGFLKFYYAETTYDLKIENDSGVYIRFEDVTLHDNIFVWPNVLSGYDNLSFTYGITAATGTFSGYVTVGGLVTGSSVTVTNKLTVSGTLDLPAGSIQGADIVSNEITSTQLADDISVSSITISGGTGLKFTGTVSTNTAPAAAGILAVSDVSYTLYLSTGTGAGAWVNVGGE